MTGKGTEGFSRNHLARRPRTSGRDASLRVGIVALAAGTLVVHLFVHALHDPAHHAAGHAAHPAAHHAAIHPAHAARGRGHPAGSHHGGRRHDAHAEQGHHHPACHPRRLHPFTSGPVVPSLPLV